MSCPFHKKNEAGNGTALPPGHPSVPGAEKTASETASGASSGASGAKRCPFASSASAGAASGAEKSGKTLVESEADAVALLTRERESEEAKTAAKEHFARAYDNLASKTADSRAAKRYLPMEAKEKERFPMHITDLTHC